MAIDRGEFAERIPQYKDRINQELATWIDPQLIASDALRDAMSYALLGGGKRIRPLLAYASGELLGVAATDIDAIAAAVEMIHCYSLAHDDLPAMDDDDIRRGRATVHIEYDEATAILVGDGLLTLAFQVLTEHPSVVTKPLESAVMVRQLAQAAGAAGMVGGQALDIGYSGTDVSRDKLEDMFMRKTGRLISAAVCLPLARAPDVADATRQRLSDFADAAGLCFQIHDDVLDLTSSTDELGKPSRSDERNDRAAYPARFGLEVAQNRVQALYQEAMQHLDSLGNRTEGLRWLTNFIVRRTH